MGAEVFADGQLSLQSRLQFCTADVVAGQSGALSTLDTHIHSVCCRSVMLLYGAKLHSPVHGAVNLQGLDHLAIQAALPALPLPIPAYHWPQ